MAILVGIPLFVVLTWLQSVIIINIKLLNGSADIILITLVAWGIHERVTSAWQWAIIGGLLICLVSGMPFMLPLFSYLIITAITRFIHKRIWQTPILAMFFITGIGTIIQHSLSIFALQFTSYKIGWEEGLSLITLPSLALNLMFTLPIYLIVTDLANWIYPVEIEI